MSKTIKVALAGAGAFGIKHLDGIQNIEGVEVVSLISRDLEKTKEVANKYGIGHVTTDLADSLALSVKTVSTYRSRVMEKMQLASNSDLTYYALKNGLIQ